jgi:hypothetical protein
MKSEVLELGDLEEPDYVPRIRLASARGHMSFGGSDLNARFKPDPRRRKW